MPADFILKFQATDE